MTYDIIDTHVHSYFPAISNDWQNILEKSNQARVKHQVQIGCDEISSLAALKLAQAHEGFYATLGLHPCDVKNVGIKNEEYHRYDGFADYQLTAQNYDELFSLFDKLATENPETVVAFGETGFDLYHENSAEILELQQDGFARHIDLAEKHDKPIIVHTRNAPKETLAAMKTNKLKERNTRGVIHCFCEDLAFAQTVTQEYGFFLGIGGVITYNNTEKIREAVAKTPIEFIVTETDAPFLTPRKAKNKKVKVNHSGLIPEVVEVIAELKNMDVTECGNILFENGKQLFNLS